MTAPWDHARSAGPYRIAIDYGTTNSAAAVAELSGPGGEAGTPEKVIFDGHPTIPSLVVLSRGVLLAGHQAGASAAANPRSTALTPKSSLEVGTAAVIDEPREVTAVEAVAATLRVLLSEAAGLHHRAPPAEVVLTHPARWGAMRQGHLRKAAVEAGVDEAIPLGLLAEPVAAALRFHARDAIPAGALVAVYDLGAGTFDTAILQRTDTGFELHGRPGGKDGLGGERFDDLLYDHLLATQVDPDDAAKIRAPGNDPVWIERRITFRARVRAAKEHLSSNPDGADIAYPVPGREPLRLTREELNELLTPSLNETIEVLAETIGPDRDRITAIYLAGGSSKIPRVEELIAERFGQVARALGDRKEVVVLGAAGAARSAIDFPEQAVPPPEPVSVPPPPPEKPGDEGGTRAPPPKRRGFGWPQVGAIGLVAALLIVGLSIAVGAGGNPPTTTPPFSFDFPTPEPTPFEPTTEPTPFEPTPEPTPFEPTPSPIVNAPPDEPPVVAGAEADNWLRSTVYPRTGIKDCAIEPIQAEDTTSVGLIAYVSCETFDTDAPNASYFLLESDEALVEWMNDIPPDWQPNTDLCGGNWWWTATPEQANGTTNCAATESGSVVEWSEDAWRIIGNLTSEVLTVDQLYERWKELQIKGTPDQP